jgi:hypothetical protein
MSTFGSAGAGAVADALCGDGLLLDYGSTQVRVRSRSRRLPGQIAAVYPHFGLEPVPAFCDLHVQLDPARGWRRVLRPQVVITSDGRQVFHPFPADTALPLLEWGTNYLIGQRLQHKLLCHAGALERGGLGLLLPATPGSGKSTLTAALSQRGWRLLSDEFGVCDLETGELSALLKPIALKNRSIDVIRHFAPAAVIGPSFPKTRKGTVAHVAAAEDAVRRRHEPARAAAVILPLWSAGSPTTLRPIEEEAVFRALAFNSFNYAVLGAAGFQAAVRLARQCRGWRLVYSDLDDAVAALERLWDGLGDRADAPPSAPRATEGSDAVA